MVKVYKIVVLGQAGCGKTSILQQLIFGNHVVGMSMFSTIEDTYLANLETDKAGIKERVIIYDTQGLDAEKPEISKQHLAIADAFILVYDVTNPISFQTVDKAKKELDRCGRINRNGAEITIISLGNKCDLGNQKKVNFESVNQWSLKEKVRLWEISVSNKSSLIDPFVWLASKLTQPQSKSNFLTIGKNKKSSISNDN